MSDSVRPHRRQHTRLPHPWDSPGMNTGVGCHFLLQCMKVKNESEVSQSCPTLSDPMNCSSPGSSVQGFPRQEYWIGLPFPSHRDLPNPGIELTSPAFSGGFFTTEPPGKPHEVVWDHFYTFSGESFFPLRAHADIFRLPCHCLVPGGRGGVWGITCSSFVLLL